MNNDCFVGVDVNCSSVHLLEKVAGLNSRNATKLMKFREENSKFQNRCEIEKVLGKKIFKQAGGFLRIFNGKNKLDQTWIHPEAYDDAELYLAEINMAIMDIGSEKLRRKSKAVNSKIEDIEADRFDMIKKI